MPSFDRASWPHLVDKGFVGQALARNAVNEAIEPLHRVALHVALIQAERELVNVATKVLLAGVVVDADQAALHDREHAFDAVGGHAVADVFAFAVVDGFVIEEQTAKAAIHASLIGMQRGTGGDVTTNGVESVFAVMKRGLIGVYHHASKKHLGRYVNEFAFRLNDGNVKRHTMERLESFVSGTKGKRLTYKGLIQ